MDEIDLDEPLTCTIVVRMNADVEIKIKATTREAVRILSGETVFPRRATRVCDLDGNELTLSSLAAKPDKIKANC